MADPDILFRFGERRPSYLRNLALKEGTGDAAAGHELDDIEASEAEDSRGRFKALPEPSGPYPFRLRLRDLLGTAEEQAIRQAGHLVFHSVGDTGQHGHGALAQERVALHLEQQVDNPTPPGAPTPWREPSFFYHLGDVIYFNGELEEYPEQFYEPYRYYRKPIVAIPGNHDGDSPRGQPSLIPFVENFCTSRPQRPPMPGQSRRRTMNQPNVYYTLEAPFVTLIGLYTNVDGHLDRSGGQDTPQFDWLVHELSEADPNAFLVVAMHHPPYSADDYHGGQRLIADVLDRAIDTSGHRPHLVLAGHVHNFQYFKRTKTTGVTGDIQYLIAGAGGYAGYDGLHGVDETVTQIAPGTTLKNSNDSLPGFLRIRVDANTLAWEYFTTPQTSDDDNLLWQRPAAFSDVIHL